MAIFKFDIFFAVTRGLEKFITPELLDRDNAYFCTNCKRKVAARKRFTIHKAPKVLTLQLKRFDYNRGFNGGKINKVRGDNGKGG